MRRGPIVLVFLTATAVAARAFPDEAGLRSQLDLLNLELTLMLPAGLPAPDAPTAEQAREKVKKALEGSGVPEVYVDSAFLDPRTTILDGIADRFSRPAEGLPYERYRQFFLTEANIANGVRFAREHKGLLSQVKARTGVDGVLVAALAGVETRYGANVGTFQVFSALYTILRRVPRRSEWAAREEAELLKLCWKQEIDPHDIVGSYAGAFGFVQFMPSSFNAYAVDFDGDGRTRLDEWPDALGSAAHYLARHGYDSSGAFEPDSSIGRSIYAYNHSENYVRVMLELRAEILQRLP